MSTPPAPRFSLLLLAYLAFVSLGLPDGLLGVGWPSIQVDFAVSTEAVGILLIAGTTGYLTSSVAAGFTLARLGVGGLLAGSTALAALALTGYLSSPQLAVMAGCALLLGLGSGAVDSGLNAYAAGAFGPRQMNWLHAFFGLGVALGPLIMTAAIGAGLTWRGGYGVVATAQGALAIAFMITVRSWHRPAETDAQITVPAKNIAPARQTLAMPALWLGASAFAVYTAIEVAAGLWAFLLLTQGRGLAPALAGLCVSGYWGSLFLGRVVQGVVAERWGSAAVLSGSLWALVLGAVLVIPSGPAWVTVVGLAIIGFAAAPIFPLLTLTTAQRVGADHADRAIGVQIGAAGLAGTLIPAGIGVLISKISVEVLGPALAILALALLGLYTAATRQRSVAVLPHRSRSDRVA